MPPPGYEPFLRAICESPEDDTERLVYADWLDENGDAERRSSSAFRLNARGSGRLVPTQMNSRAATSNSATHAGTTGGANCPGCRE